jgi:hypothetical protein
MLISPEARPIPLEHKQPEASSGELASGALVVDG